MSTSADYINLEKLAKLKLWLDENPPTSKNQMNEIMAILHGLRTKIQFEYDSQIVEKMSLRKNVSTFYAKALNRIKSIPKDILNIPACRMKDRNVDFKDEILFAQPSNAEKLLLDRNHVAKCAKKIMKHQRKKKIHKVYKSKKLGFSNIKRRTKKKQNRNNNIYSKSAIRQNLDESQLNHLRNPIIDKSIFRSKTPKYRKWKGKGKKKGRKLKTRKKGKKNNQLGRSLI